MYLETSADLIQHTSTPAMLVIICHSATNISNKSVYIHIYGKTLCSYKHMDQIRIEFNKKTSLLTHSYTGQSVCVKT